MSIPIRPPLVRKDTTVFSKMQKKATSFNDMINLKKNDWDTTISFLLDALNKKATGSIIMPDNGNFINKCLHNHIKINPDNTVTNNLIPEQLKIFTMGGASYSAYGKFFEELGHIPMESASPRTHDWDIVICVDDFNDEILEYFKNISISIANNIYTNFSQSSYFSSFLDIDTPVGSYNKETREVTYYVHPSKKIELVYIKTKKYLNFRLDLALNIDGVYEKNHIIEIVLWNKLSNLSNSINTINVLELKNGIKYFVPELNNLINYSLIAIINRSSDSYKFAKCRQDYSRIKYICDTYSIMPSGLKEKIGNLTDICVLLEKFADKLRHCSTILTDDEYDIIKKRLVDNPEYIAYIEENKKELRELVEKFFSESAYEEDIEDVINEVSYDQDDEPMDYYKKYIKYKNKYLNLKNASSTT
jgi:hypothetical protein